MPSQTLPFEPAHLPAAAALVCQRYRNLCEDVPALPQRYAQADAFLPRLENLLQESPPGCALAHIRNGELAGFLLGLEIPDFLGRRTVYSPEWANAALLDESFAIYEALYTSWSAAWMAQGCASHLFSLLANDYDAVDCLQWLGFGMAAVDGLRDLSPLPAQTLSGGTVHPLAAPDIQVRRVLSGARGEFPPSDRLLAARFDQALLEHVAAAPCFWPHDADEAPTFSGADWLSAPGNALFFAQHGAETLAYIGVSPCSQDACTIIRDPGTASIAKAYTLPERRGSGAGALLLSHALAWAQEQGYQRCSVDYEAANPPARRFWGRWFEPVVFSLLRVVGEKP